MTFEEQLKTTGKIIYTNKGVSMMPLLREDKDIMVIEACDTSELKKNDAVLFIRPRIQGRGHYVLHRILKVNEDGTFWIVGDNCVSGENVPGEYIIGKLTAVIRDGKEIKVTDKMYQAYVHLWCDVYPARFAVLRGKNFVRRGLSFVKRRVLKIK